MTTSKDFQAESLPAETMRRIAIDGRTRRRYGNTDKILRAGNTITHATLSPAENSLPTIAACWQRHQLGSFWI